MFRHVLPCKFASFGYAVATYIIWLNNFKILFNFKIFIIDSYFIFMAHPTNPVECCADANPKTMLPNDT